MFACSVSSICRWTTSSQTDTHTPTHTVQEKYITQTNRTTTKLQNWKFRKRERGKSVTRYVTHTNTHTHTHTQIRCPAKVNFFCMLYLVAKKKSFLFISPSNNIWNCKNNGAKTFFEKLGGLFCRSKNNRNIFLYFRKTDAHVFIDRNLWGNKAEEFIFAQPSILLFVEGPQQQKDHNG